MVPKRSAPSGAGSIHCGPGASGASRLACTAKISRNYWRHSTRLRGLLLRGATRFQDRGNQRRQLSLSLLVIDHYPPRRIP